MCANPVKIVKNIFSPPKPQRPKVVVENSGPDPKTMEQLNQQRNELQRQRQEFSRQQNQFQKDQQRWLKDQQSKETQPVVVPVVEKKQATPQTASEADRALASRRRGRGSLRIPRTSNTNAGAGGTGLNVPRG